MRKVIPILMAMMLSGCSVWTSFKDSFKPIPGQHITLPVREPVFGTSYSVSVRMSDGDYSPFCTLPDAANDIDCLFYWGWFENGGLVSAGTDGYRFLNYPDALQACQRAMFSAMGNQGEVEACARALLYFRYVVAPPDPDPNR